MNQIRVWVRQGRTDAWVAHQLEVSVQDIEQFKRQNELVGDEDAAGSAGATDYEEIDLRAEDDALIAAELEAAEIEAERIKAEAPPEPEEDEGDSESDEQDAPRRRGRSRRGGRGRRPARPNAGPLEGTFDHGEEGYGLWLDPAVQDNPIYAEHWAGHRPVEVLVEEDRIVIRRTGSDSDD
ncbi:MAG TPA: hypothetical protein VFC30_08995 [Solirubrobacteraceae bacterium]|nr:hypothetical protein [Solirubrobacteraceae bacterium]